MNRPTLIVVVIALVVMVAGAYYWYSYLRTTPEEQALQDAADLLVGGAAQDLSSAVDTSVNAVGETPDANPLTKTNPFSGVKTNPFE
ncbi:MAG: hypothetical protein V1656_01835 [Candidatus Jorgensenbacteria bacterium]